MTRDINEKDIHQKSEHIVRLNENFKTIRHLASYLWPDDNLSLKFRILLAVSLLGLAKGVNVSIPYFLKEAVDQLSANTSDLIIVPIALIAGYGIARVLAQAFSELRDAIFSKVGQRAIRLAGLKTFKHLHLLGLRFHIQRKTGGISRAVERGTKGIEFILRFMLFNILPTLLEFFLVCGILWYLYGVIFTGIIICTLIFYVAWTFIGTEFRLKYRRAMNQKDSEAHTKAIDSLLNFETVKYFGNEDHEAERFNLALKGYEKMAIKSEISLAFLNIGQVIIIALGITISMIVAGYEVEDGSMTIGDFVMINAYLIQLFLPLNFLGFVYREIKRSLADMEAMFALTSQNIEIRDKPNAPSLKFKGGAVSFENVAFNYQPENSVLRNISFTIRPGEKVAIVGPSGSGKSTISRLLFRFYDVTSGRITIDQQDIRDISQESLRGVIGIVPQDTVLFNESIYYNINYGRPEASASEVEAAAVLSKIHDFIKSLPNGYDTNVGERGLKLSGGEKQRIAIARTILKRPKILVFDEATSALDSVTESKILTSLDEVSADITTLTIAHRLSTIINSDKILVLAEGTLIERGSHHELLKKNGRYAEMWHHQRELEKARIFLEKKNQSEAI